MSDSPQPQPTVSAAPAAAAAAENSSAPQPLLDVIGITVQFEGLTALTDCSIALYPRTISGLIGPNGAGKTTLFNVITGFQRPRGGQIVFRGERIDRLPPHRVVRKGITRTFQIPRPFTSMSVLENLMLFPTGQAEAVWDGWVAFRRVARMENALHHKALGVLEVVGLSHVRDNSAAHLSGGQKKLLELGRALMADPQVILLDEPGAGVNPTLAKQLMDAVQTLRRERGITFLIIEHDIDLIARNCDPVIVLNNGTKLMEGTAAEVRQDPRVLEAYLGT